MDARQDSLSEASISRKRKIIIQGTVFVLGLIVLSFAQPTPSIQGSEEGLTASVDASQGLRGILPAEVPLDLNVEEFEVLTGNWKTRGEELAALVTKLYEDETLKTDGQKKLIGQINHRLKTMEAAILDRRQQQLHGPLISLHGRISRRVALAEAALKTLNFDASAEKKNRIAKARAGVVKATDHLEKSLRRIENGMPWFDYVQGTELRKLAREGKNASASITAIEKKFAGKSSLTEAQKSFFSREMFAYYIQEAKHLRAAENMTVDDSNAKAIRAELGNLVSALEQFEATNLRSAAGKARQAFDKLRDLTPDGGDAISVVLRSYYFNYNVRIVISENFADKIIREKRIEKRPVKDFILGADVTGNSNTVTTSGIDFKRSDEGIRFDLTVKGIVNSETQGETKQATVYTDGYHRFWARKPIFFDGKQFHYNKSATLSVDANNTTTGATTSFSRFPIFGGFADRFAMSQARRKRSQSEAIARSRVADQVIPEMNDKVAEEFARFNKYVKKNYVDGLKEAGLSPSAESLYSTSHRMVMNRRLMNFGELGGNFSVQPINPGKGVAIGFHESMFNNAIDKMNLAGKTLTEAEFKHEFENALTDVLGRDVNFGGEEKTKKNAGPDTFILDKNDPIRFEIDNGELRITLRMGFKQTGKKDIPAQVVTIPLKIDIVGDDLVFSRGEAVSISPVAPPARRALQIARAGVIRKKIESSLPTRKHSRKFNIKRQDKKPIVLQIKKIEALNGWLTLWME